MKAKTLRQVYGDLSILVKNFVPVCLILLLTVILIMGYSLNQASKISSDRLMDSLKSTVRQAQNNLEDYIEKLQLQARLFCGNELVVTTARRINREEFSGLAERLQVYRDMEQAINYYEQINGDFGIRLAFDEEHLFFRDGLRYGEASFLQNSAGTPPDERYIMQPDGRGDVAASFVHPILDMDDWNDVQGQVLFDIPRHVFGDILKPLAEIDGSHVYIHDRQGRVVAAGAAGEPPEFLRSEEYLGRIAQEGPGLRVRVEGGAMRFYTPIAGTPYYLSAQMPYGLLSQERDSLVMGMLGWGLMVLVLSFFASYFLTKSITRRIRVLIDTMDKVEQSDFSMRLAVKHRDEIGSLETHFNNMSDRIRRMVLEKYKNELQRKDLELAVLQAQINPHFLYNVLDCVNWEAIRLKADSISFVVKNLSDFLRIGLNNGRGKSTVGHEISHVQSYFNLQHYRYEDKISLHWDVPPELAPVEIVPTVLQPLVENSILHGLLELDRAHGDIFIRAFESGGVMTIEVADTGCGIARKKLEEIRTALERGEVRPECFGLCNVNRRLRIAYGGGYGLEIDSEEGRGTVCRVVVPTGIVKQIEEQGEEG